MTALDTSGWAVVTGASSGIGAALAEELARRGHPVILVARRKARLDELADRIARDHGAKTEVLQCDLADAADRDRLYGELAGRDVSVLCNNAGFPVCGNVFDGDPRRLSRQLEVNVVAAQELTLAVVPAMLARGCGAVLFTGSTAGIQPIPSAAGYAAAKAYVNTFAESLHVELRGTGVTCTVLTPGPVRTEFSRVGGIGDIERHRWMAWQSAPRVARDAVNAMAAGRRTVVPGVVAKAQAFGGRHVPRWVLFPALRGFVLPRIRAAATTSEPPADAGATRQDRGI